MRTYRYLLYLAILFAMAVAVVVFAFVAAGPHRM